MAGGFARRSWVTVLVLGLACATGDELDSDGPQLGGDSTGSTTPTSGGDDDDDDGEDDAGDDDDVGMSDGVDDGPATSGPDTDDGATDGTTGPCEPTTWGRDTDDDGYGDPDDTTEACAQPPGYVPDTTDCDDGDPDVYPGANESCGGPDRNCDFEAPPLCNSCLQLLDSGNGDASGLYTIDPDGPVQPLPPSQVWCDQTTDGGGWTLVQRTVWEPAQTDALRTGFDAWRDQTVGNPAAGQGFRLMGEAWGHLNLQLDHMLRHEIRMLDGESCEPLFYVGTGGELTVEGGVALLTGMTADVSIVSGTELSSTDSGPSQSCVNGNLGVPWFYAACCATCPTYQGAYWTEPHPMASYVHSVPDLSGNTQTEVCSGPVEMAINGSAYRGIAAMEYYLR